MTFIADSLLFLKRSDAKMTNEQFPRFMNLTQTRKYLNVGSMNTVYKLVEEQGLPIIKMGTLKRVDQVALNKWLQEKTVK